MQVIDTLKLIHDKSFIHLDLKPDNILIGSDDFWSLESSVIYLIDFGISQRYLDHLGNHYERNY